MALLLLELEFRWWTTLASGVWYNWACVCGAINEIYVQGFEVEFLSQQTMGNGYELSATTGWNEDLISTQLSALLSLNGFFELG